MGGCGAPDRRFLRGNRWFAQSSAAPGDYFDGNVLRAILGLGKAVKTRGVRYELSPENRAGLGFVLEASDCPAIEERLRLIPAPRAFW